MDWGDSGGGYVSALTLFGVSLWQSYLRSALVLLKSHQRLPRKSPTKIKVNVEFRTNVVNFIETKKVDKIWLQTFISCCEIICLGPFLVILGGLRGCLSIRAPPRRNESNLHVFFPKCCLKKQTYCSRYVTFIFCNTQLKAADQFKTAKLDDNHDFKILRKSE